MHYLEIVYTYQINLLHTFIEGKYLYNEWLEVCQYILIVAKWMILDNVYNTWIYSSFINIE